MTAVQICNLALSRLGSSLFITVLGEDTAQAIQCNLIYENVRDMTLEDFPWNFATRSAALTEQTTETHPFYDYVYAYPTCFKVHRVFAEGAEKTSREEFAIFNQLIAGVSPAPNTEAKRIACDIEDAYAEYTVPVTDPTMFSYAFVDALAWRIASQLAIPITGDPSKVGLLDAQYRAALSTAKAFDANEGVQTPAKSSKYKDSRG
jgi:hypothetical protein